MSHLPTPKQLQRTAGQIMALLSTNCEFPRFQYDMSDKQLPTGSNIMGQLIKQHRFDAVRGEILGVTLTVEITNERKGEQPTDDETQLRYSTNSYELFRMWLFKRIRESGVEPKYPGFGVPPPTVEKRPSTIKMDLRKPFIHSKRDRR